MRTLAAAFNRRMKSVLKAALRRTPYRVVRARDANRFQAIEDTLLALKARGFSPKIVLDGGANVGDFGRMARRVFGANAEIHLFEPQPACLPHLEALTKQQNFILHTVAIGARDEILELAIDPSSVTTGAHVKLEGGAESVSVRSVTLDGLFQEKLRDGDRTLLKLDLQGWEMEALRGSVGILPKIEIVLTEASFFAQAYEPSIADLIRFFDAGGFDLHDIASLSARRRDNRAHQADLVFVSRLSPLARDTAWA